MAQSRDGEEQGPDQPTTSPTQLQVIAMRMQELTDQAFALSNQHDDPDKLTDAGRRYRGEQVTALLAASSSYIDDAARNWVCQTILDGDMSRKRAAEMLGVHQATIARWVKQYTDAFEPDDFDPYNTFDGYEPSSTFIRNSSNPKWAADYNDGSGRRGGI